MIEVRFHGIGGDGVVTAADLLSEAAVLDGNGRNHCLTSQLKGEALR